MTFGYNADIKSSLVENFTRIKSIAASLLNRLANERTTDEGTTDEVYNTFNLGILFLTLPLLLLTFLGINEADRLHRPQSRGTGRKSCRCSYIYDRFRVETDSPRLS